MNKLGNIFILVASALLVGLMLFGTGIDLDVVGISIILAFSFAMVNIFKTGKLWAILSAIFALVAGIWSVFGGFTLGFDGTTQIITTISIPLLIAGSIMVFITAGKQQ